MQLLEFPCHGLESWRLDLLVFGCPTCARHNETCGIICESINIHHEHFVISYTCQYGVIFGVPIYILYKCDQYSRNRIDIIIAYSNNRCMTSKDSGRFDSGLSLRVRINVPMNDIQMRCIVSDKSQVTYQ